MLHYYHIFLVTVLQVVSVVQGGLKDLSVSRTSFDWGISLPSDEGKGHVM